MEPPLICRECKMEFRSTRLLEKHTAMFCIGGEVEVTGVDAKLSGTPEPVQTKGQRRNRHTTGGSAEAELKSGPEDEAATAQTDGAALRNLTGEFHRLTMLMEENLPHWSRSSAHAEGHTERLKEMREMATLHERQVAVIRSHNQQLEQQRDELAHQVSVLSEQSRSGHLENLLTELKEQEERNEETLRHLAQHLQALHVRPTDRLDPAEEKKMHPDNYELITAAEGPLSAQIQGLRHTYLQSGGSDPNVVAQMIDLQAGAQSLEKNHKAAAAAAESRPRLPGPSWELLALEQENHRLEEEILRMQLDRERRHGHEGRHMLDHLDSLGPAPYDPAAGFVVFFDLALGVHPSQKALRLVAALYSDGVEVGPPTPLPPVQCLSGSSSLYTHGVPPGHFALLSVKLPISRIQPSASLRLLVEVQAARDLDVRRQEVVRLSSSGWTRLELFDQHNQLCSGHWRAPVRCLPVKPSLSVAQLNSTSQVGNAELCVRLANSRDEDMQTLVKPDPASTRHYRYQPVASSLHMTGRTALSVSGPQSTDEDGLFLQSSAHRRRQSETTMTFRQ